MTARKSPIILPDAAITVILHRLEYKTILQHVFHLMSTCSAKEDVLVTVRQIVEQCNVMCVCRSTIERRNMSASMNCSYQ